MQIAEKIEKCGRGFMKSAFHFRAPVVYYQCADLILNQDPAFLRHINNDWIAVLLAPGGATAKHGKIAPQQIQEFIGGAI